MKTILALATLALLSFSAHAAEPKCVVAGRGNGNENVKFKIVDGVPGEKEFHTIEQGSSNGVTFRLREGHGQMRLEAYRKGKFNSGTFSSRSDELNLDDGKEEAMCSDLNEESAPGPSVR